MRSAWLAEPCVTVAAPAPPARRARTVHDPPTITAGRPGSPTSRSFSAPPTSPVFRRMHDAAPWWPGLPWPRGGCPGNPRAQARGQPNRRVPPHAMRGGQRFLRVQRPAFAILGCSGRGRADRLRRCRTSTTATGSSPSWDDPRCCYQPARHPMTLFPGTGGPVLQRRAAAEGIAVLVALPAGTVTRAWLRASSTRWCSRCWRAVPSQVGPHHGATPPLDPLAHRN